jgi:uncharacterized membrane protein (UPF0127 family)
MSKRRVCVFNQTRQSFLSLDTTVADTQLARLRGLLGRRELKSDHGLWLVPCQGIHTIGLVFPIDVVYLDVDHRVVHVIEYLQPFRITSIRRNCHSVLELPVRTIFESETETGDQIAFFSASEQEYGMNVELEAQRGLQRIADQGAPAAIAPDQAVVEHEEGFEPARQDAQPQRRTELQWRRRGSLYLTKPDGPS